MRRKVANEVGVRELKARLSEHLRRVKLGEVIVITDRGRQVARIVPAELPEGIARMMREGRLRWSGRKPGLPRVRARIEGRPNLADIVIRDRG
jgi:prevent-host-death family protein